MVGFGSLKPFPLPLCGGAFLFGAGASSSVLNRTVWVPASRFSMWPIFFLILRKASLLLTRMSMTNSSNVSSLLATSLSSTHMHFAQYKTPPGNIAPSWPSPRKNNLFPLTRISIFLQWQIYSPPLMRWSSRHRHWFKLFLGSTSSAPKHYGLYAETSLPLTRQASNQFFSVLSSLSIIWTRDLFVGCLALSHLHA